MNRGEEEGMPAAMEDPDENDSDSVNDNNNNEDEDYDDFYDSQDDSENDVETGTLGDEEVEVEVGRLSSVSPDPRSSLIVAGAPKTSSNSSKSSKGISYKYFGRLLILVDLKLLNQAMDNPNYKTLVTTKPVNKFGFPPGFGRDEDEQSGPYLYVACALTKVVRRPSSTDRNGFIAVERCDTETLQTIRSDWETHVLDNTMGINAAIAAAKYNELSKTSTHSMELGDSVDLLSRSSHHFQQPLPSGLLLESTPSAAAQWKSKLKQWVVSRLVPTVRKWILASRAFVTQLLQGQRPFSCKVRFTGINLLVICSSLFLFLQVFVLAFGPARLDDDFAILGLVIWSILVLELIFEVLIRPADYKQLMQSDKAYRPSSARHINTMYLAGEALALFLYIPEIVCLRNTNDVCPYEDLTLVRASAFAVLGPTPGESIYGRLVLGALALRFFGVVRHWQQMSIQQLFHPMKRQGLEKWLIPLDPHVLKQRERKRLEKKDDDDVTVNSDDLDDDLDDTDDSLDSRENRRLKSAANIGTALMVVNCQRALLLMLLAVVALPLFYTVTFQNSSATNLANMLEAENLVSTTGIDDCEYLEQAIDSWLNMAIVDPLNDAPDVNHFYMKAPYVLWARVLPVRCPFQNETGVITSCTGKQARFRNRTDFARICDLWDNADPPPFFNDDTTVNIRDYFARWLDVRGDGIFVYQRPEHPDSFHFEALNPFNVTVIVDHNLSIRLVNWNHFLLGVTVFFVSIFFLVVLRTDVYKLGLNPIQRMLRIVIRYAENPLSSGMVKKKSEVARTSTARDDIGDIETEQLLGAITKISDLLRKCWGVAGAGIISSNLGRDRNGQVAVFNPTVPGKQVYALFAFVSICGYSDLLKALDRDIMILINDVARVVHDEVYRWALGDHGQCNKNLGPCFLMVWRIGDFNEVQQKNKAAIEKLFRDKVYKTTTNNRSNHPKLRRRLKSAGYSKNSTIRSNASTVRSNASSTATSKSGSQEIQLENLPGIQGFADRALLGMLKSFAGIHRDRFLYEWKSDSRFRSCEPANTVDIIYGMDAGWAMEGAVGSEYKIDATYLSPHVNMASRMMSASKQYGATILLSKAVEKLLSKPCRNKLRHLDTVYVKGSAIKQAIYTYDARYAGVDFFLLERTPDQADRESESYSAAIWDQDQDLMAMRRHVTEDFMETYHRGVKQYLEGQWTNAHKSFQDADDIMIQTVLEEGYIEIADDYLLETLEARILDRTDTGKDVEKLRHEFGDGACRTLMTYMERRNFEPPEDWKGVRQLFSK